MNENTLTNNMIMKLEISSSRPKNIIAIEKIKPKYKYYDRSSVQSRISYQKNKVFYPVLQRRIFNY